MLQRKYGRRSKKKESDGGIKTRSIILTDEQYVELIKILNYAFVDDTIMSEPLWREIKDVKRCSTCKHWVEEHKHYGERCEIWHNDEEISEGENKNVLDCWERK